MNTVKSVYYGWATLIAAGGGAYYFAKKSINADRAQKAEADRVKRQRQYQLEQAHGMHGGAAANPTISPNAVVSADMGARRDEENGHVSPSVQASADPAATRHAPGVEGDKSKYEASDVFRSRKGDRFS